jgi:glutamate synthase domain-containing protein 2
LFVALFLFIIFDLKKSIYKLREANDASLIAIKSVSRQNGLIENLIERNKQIIP